MKKIIAILGCSFCFLISCQSPQEKAYNHLYDIYEDLSTNSEYYTSEDWDYILRDYAETDSILSSYELTEEEKKAVNELRGKCSVYFFKGAADAVGSELNKMFNGLGDYLNGVSEELNKN